MQINPTNPWNHIAVTVLRNSSTPSGVFYINGQQAGSFTPNMGPVSNNVNLWIGNSRISNNNCIVIIDELELFNRALASSEVYNIWAADSCGKCKAPINGVDDNSYEFIPTEFTLLQCFPNPFNPITTIQFHLPKAEFVKLNVYDNLGQEVAVLVKTYLPAGLHKVEFDGNKLSSGIYYYQLRAGKFIQTRKMILQK